MNTKNTLSTSSHRQRVTRATLFALMMALCAPAVTTPLFAAPAAKMSADQINEYWHNGKTLPLEVGKQYPPDKLNIPNDKGYNILIDISHQCSFASLWGLGGPLMERGFRPVTNQASLDTVLKKEGKSRVRIPVDPQNGIRPFAWYPNFPVNVVITEQTDPNGQEYTKVEQKALVDFVKNGGSLIIQGCPVGDAEKMKAWSLNALAAQFGGELLPEADTYAGTQYAGLKLGEGWETTAKGDKGLPVQARRSFGKGKVILHGHVDAIRRGKKEDSGSTQKEQYVSSLLDWATQDQKRLTDEPRLPQPMGGGGAIYPEKENNDTDIIVYYAANQKPHLLKTVTESFPLTTKKVQGWLPSLPTKEPMFLILSAGDGGGWAVNAFKPKENGIISDSAAGLISIYAHELAHTMGGPPNDKDELAADTPFHNQGEAHAGWFQGKADAIFDETRRDKPNRNCNSAFENKKILGLDLKKQTLDGEYAKDFNKGEDWTKTWYIWQKLDDRYGSTWYPRWKWVQHTRWANDKGRRLTWEETVEDMSIACGEDLFPFFHKINVKLDRPTAGELEFQGKKMTLSPAPIEATPAGPINLDDIGDYKKPLTPRS